MVSQSKVVISVVIYKMSINVIFIMTLIYIAGYVDRNDDEIHDTYHTMRFMEII